MKTLLKILIAVGALIAILLLIAIFVKKDYGVEREVVINKPKEEVFNYIKFIKNQDYFSKWAKIDPKMKKTYRGIDGTVGFVYMWESHNDNIGKGEQEIKKITEGKRVDFELRFIKPFNATDEAYLSTEEITPTQTRVKWGFDGHMAYPMNLMLLFMDFDKMLGNDLQTGLNKLKIELEKQ